MIEESLAKPYKWRCAGCKFYDLTYMGLDDFCSSPLRYFRERSKRIAFDKMTDCVENGEDCKYYKQGEF